ncbi:hypothetical protein [Lysinibacillus sp. NPDC056185]|uniref:hypothetical protein n=1 Tax=Lysinibacillus sp. NPDC056185 TaxID=3345739 RepID=UPI0039EF9461
MTFLSVTSALLSVALVSIRHLGDSFRRSRLSIRRFDVSFRHFGSSFRRSDFHPSPWRFFPSVSSFHPSL